MQGVGRLSINTSLSSPHVGYGQSAASPPSGNRSASQAQAQREIKELREENSALRQELQEVRTLYNQLVQESSHENFDERRVNLLKSQVIQLERQVLLLSDAIGSRSAVLLEVENAISYLTDTCRVFIAKEVKGPEVPVPRSELTRMVETAESARIKLYKNIENSTTERMSKPLLLMNQYVKSGQEGQPLTMMDICSGDLKYINLKHVGKLESKLSNLYRYLLNLHQSLYSLSSHACKEKGSQHLNSAIYDRLNQQVTKATKLTKECTENLLDLGVLVPQAPWPVLQRHQVEEMTVDSIMKRLPNFPRSKQQEARGQIEALLKAMNYSTHSASLEAKSNIEEVKFHQSVYNLQISYIQSLFQAVREGYSQFEESSYNLICKPMKGILEAYHELRNTTSENALREFLETFKADAEKIEAAIESLTPKAFEVSEGQQALSEFGEQFFESLEKLQKERQVERDEQISELDIVKQQKEQNIQECLLLFKPEVQEETPSDLGDEYENIVRNEVLDDSLNSSGLAERREERTPSRKERSQVGRTAQKEESCSCGAEGKEKQRVRKTPSELGTEEGGDPAPQQGVNKSRHAGLAPPKKSTSSRQLTPKPSGRPPLARTQNNQGDDKNGNPTESTERIERTGESPRGRVSGIPRGGAGMKRSGSLTKLDRSVERKGLTPPGTPKSGMGMQRTGSMPRPKGFQSHLSLSPKIAQEASARGAGVAGTGTSSPLTTPESRLVKRERVKVKSSFSNPNEWQQ